MCEDLLICDLAEVYHIFNYEEHPPLLVGALCFGLSEDSRVKRFLSGTNITLNQMLLARIADELAFLSWLKTKDGAKNRNRPQSILQTLLNNNEPQEKQLKGYESVEDFTEAWNKIAGE